MALCFQECLESGYIDCHVVVFSVLDQNSFQHAGYRLCWVCSKGMALCFQECLESGYIDCHVVVFSVLDRNSFRRAEMHLKDLKAKRSKINDPVVILVANKQDIVRNRQVYEHGKAETFYASFLGRARRSRDGLMSHVRVILVVPPHHQHPTG